MKWYETPVEELYDAAIEALARNDEDSYKENLLHVYTLIRERYFQKVRASENPENASSCYKGLDCLLHMEQSKLRVMTDDILQISQLCLTIECIQLYKAERYKNLKCRTQRIGLFKQAIWKLQYEKDRRTRVYGLDARYWA